MQREARSPLHRCASSLIKARHIAVKSERAGQRVMHSVTRWIEDSLRLTVNSRKSAVDRPWNRKFLGFTLSRRDKSLKVADAAIDKLKDSCENSAAEQEAKV